KPPAATVESRSTSPVPNGGLELERILFGLTALKQGDFRVRLPVTWTGLNGKIADSFNELAELMDQSTERLRQISWVVGHQGRSQERLPAGVGGGAWSERANCVNTLIDCLAHPISETARVIGAVARGDLSQTMALEINGRRLEGDSLRTAKAVN